MFLVFQKLQFSVVFFKEAHSPERYEKLKEALEILDKMLENQDYVAGRNLTIADLTIIVTVTTIEVTILILYPDIWTYKLYKT